MYRLQWSLSLGDGDKHELIRDLRQMSIIEKTSGKLKLDHPRTSEGHGDNAAAFALALMAAKRIQYIVTSRPMFLPGPVLPRPYGGPMW